MTILVIGAGEAAGRVAGALEASHCPVQRCRTADKAVPLLDYCAERYSLILSEDSVDSQVLATHLGDKIQGTPVVAIGAFGQACATRTGAAPMCSIKRTADGGHQLRCALSEASAQPDSHSGLAHALEDQPAAFVYSAPVAGRR